jgi:hypothetical protein
MVCRVNGEFKRSARKQYKSIKQGGYESLIPYQEPFDAELKAYQEQENPEMEDTGIVLDFLGLKGVMFSSRQISIIGWQ